MREYGVENRVSDEKATHSANVFSFHSSAHFEHMETMAAL